MNSIFNIQYYRGYSNIDSRFDAGLISEILEATPAQVLAVLGYVDHPYIRDTSLLNDRNNLEITHQFSLAEQLRVIWGAEYRVDKFRGADWVDTTDTFQNISQRLFFNGEWKPGEHWIFNIGDMVEKSSVIRLSHSPRVALNYDIGNGHYIRGAASRAWRAPTFIENEMNYHVRIYDSSGDIFKDVTLFSSSGGLKPENMRSTELAVGGELVSNALSYEVRIFRDQMTNLMTVSKNTDSNIYEIINAGEANIKGAEFQLKWHPLKKTLIYLGYSHYDADGYLLKRHPLIESDDVKELVPRGTVSFLLSQALSQKFKLGVSYHQAMNTNFLAGDQTKGISTLDMKLSYAFRSDGNKGDTLFVTGRNLLGEFADFEDETRNKPEFFIGIKANL